MTDQQALEQYARNGDPAAFGQLVETYQRLVYAACRRQLRSEADVEDAVQETFLRLAKHASRVRRNLGGWLHTCATHVSITRIRRDATRRRHEAAWTPVSDPAAAAESYKIMAQVDVALEQLRDADRELILSYYLQGQTQSALANAQGVSQPGLKYRLERAVQRLRAQLKKRGVATSATALSAFFITDATHAQVPASLSTGLTKLGLSGIGATAGSTTAGLTAWLAPTKLLWAGVATVALTATTVAVYQSRPASNTSNTPTQTQNTPGLAPLATPNDPDAGPPKDPAFARTLHMAHTQTNGQAPFNIRFENNHSWFAYWHDGGGIYTAFDGHVSLDKLLDTGSPDCRWHNGRDFDPDPVSPQFDDEIKTPHSHDEWFDWVGQDHL